MHRQRRATGGVLLIRLAGLPPESKADIVSSFVRDRAAELEGGFTVAPGAARVPRPRA